MSPPQSPVSPSPSRSPLSFVTHPPPSNQPYCNALRCITFFPCSCPRDFLYPNPRKSFKPLYVHFFFEDERVVGWDSCDIRIFFTPDLLDVYIDVNGTPNPSHAPTLPQTQQASCLPSPSPISSFAASPSKTSSSQSKTSLPCSADEDEQSAFHRRAVDAILWRFDKAPLPGGFCKSAEEFLKKLSVDKRRSFVPPGVPYMTLDLHTKGHERVSKNALASDPEFAKLHVYNVVFYPNDLTVHYIHRRVEWLLHFFIDACSSIEYDPRWRVMLGYVKRPLTPPDETVAKNAKQELPASTHKKRAVKRSRADMEASASMEVAQETPTSRLNRRSARTAQSPPKSNPLNPLADEDTPSKDPSKCDMSPSTAKHKSTAYRYELVALASLYKFFALPKCRRRVSQFFVLPTFQGMGVGLQLLELVHRFSLVEEDVMEFAVEDPAHAFKQLRDLVSLKVAIQQGIVPKSCLYPPVSSDQPTKGKAADVNTEVQTANGEKHDSTDDFTSKLDAIVRRLRTETKESKIQAARLRDILRFCRVMPHPMPPPPQMLYQRNVDVAHFDKEDGSLAGAITGAIGRDWRPLNCSEAPFSGAHLEATTDTVPGAVQLSSFANSDSLKELRIALKKHMRLEHIEWLGALKPSQARYELDVLWQKTYTLFYRTVKKLRTMFMP